MEEKRGSSVKYLSIPFYDHLKTIPPYFSPTLLPPPSCTFRASFQSYPTSDTSTFLWNEYSLLSLFICTILAGASG